MNADEELATLLDQVTQQQQNGQQPDFDALGRQHPQWIDELRQLAHVAELANQFGSAVLTSQTTAPHAPTIPQSPPTENFDGYNLLGEIGRGAMGVVYKAWDPQLQRIVALKMLLGGEHASAVDLARFRTEAQAAARLAHRNIIPVYKVGEYASRAYFSMQYVEGPTLADLAHKGPMDQREAARLVSLIAQGVQAAHQQGILHRDLKPANVLIDKEGQPVITDFGLAKRAWMDSRGSAGRLTTSGAIVGTPSYMAPEQAAALAGSIGPASDVYSLGAILYELLTGRPPFQASSAVDVLLMVRSEEALRPRLLNRAIDPDLELICLKCLEKSPAHRYASAAHLAADLEAYLHSEPVSARSSSLVYFISHLFRDTHHAPVMENWGGLWMVHSAFLLFLCVVTNVLWWAGVNDHLSYLLLWSFGLVVWGLVFWNWRQRGGAVTFVERQMAHGWAAGVAASIGTFIVEVALNLPVLTLTPMLAVEAGIVFVFMAGTVSGWFYFPAALCFIAALPMAFCPGIAPTLFGVVAAIGFFVPGWKYYRKLPKRGSIRFRVH